ncbi:MAG: MBL fold metallo-hydrolase [Aquincola tertiaricarbonis]
MPALLTRRALALGLLCGGTLAGCSGRAARQWAQAPPAIDRDASATEVAAGVWMLPGTGGEPDARNLGRVANAGFVQGPRGVLAVDAGTSLLHGQALLRAIVRHAGQPPQAVLITQTKPDVLFGAPALRAAGARVLMQRQAAVLMAARCSVCLRNLQRDVGAAAMAGTELFEADVLFDEAPPLPDIGRPLRVLYPGPASGPGDVALLDEASGVLFAGGLVEGGRIPNLHDADLPGWLQALEGLQRLAAGGRLRALVPGHGPFQLDAAAAIGRTAGYLQALQARVAALVDEGVPLSALPERAALPAYAGWDGYPQLHRRNAGLLYLRLEQQQLMQPAQPGAAAGR